MNPRLRFALSCITGIITAIVLVSIIESIGHRKYPPPTDLDWTDKEAVGAFVKTLPTGALLYVLAAWVIGAFVGSTVGGLMARPFRVFVAVVVGAFVLMASVFNLVMIPHPVWFAISAVVLVPLAAFAAVKIPLPGGKQ